MLSGLQSQCESYGREKNLLHLAGIKLLITLPNPLSLAILSYLDSSFGHKKGKAISVTGHGGP
jgi:hypothetical protein